MTVRHFHHHHDHHHHHHHSWFHQRTMSVASEASWRGEVFLPAPSPSSLIPTLTTFITPTFTDPSTIIPASPRVVVAEAAARMLPTVPDLISTLHNNINNNNNNNKYDNYNTRTNRNDPLQPNRYNNYPLQRHNINNNNNRAHSIIASMLSATTTTDAAATTTTTETTTTTTTTTSFGGDGGNSGSGSSSTGVVVVGGSDASFSFSLHRRTLEAAAGTFGEGSATAGTTPVGGSFGMQEDGHFLAVWGVLVLVLALAVLTLVANSTILTMFVLRRSVRRCKNIYIASLAAADLGIGLTMPVAALQQVESRWVLQGGWCHLYQTVRGSLLYVSLLSILLISLDRWWSIHYPFTYRAKQSRRLAAGAVAAVWVISFALHVPPVLLWDHIVAATATADVMGDDVSKGGGFSAAGWAAAAAGAVATEAGRGSAVLQTAEEYRASPPSLLAPSSSSSHFSSFSSPSSSSTSLPSSVPPSSFLLFSLSSSSSSFISSLSSSSPSSSSSSSSSSLLSSSSSSLSSSSSSSWSSPSSSFLSMLLTTMRPEQLKATAATAVTSLPGVFLSEAATAPTPTTAPTASALSSSLSSSSNNAPDVETVQGLFLAQQQHTNHIHQEQLGETEEEGATTTLLGGVVSSRCELPYGGHFSFVLTSSVVLYVLPVLALWVLNCSLYLKISRRKSIKIRRSLSVNDNYLLPFRKSSSESESSPNNNTYHNTTDSSVGGGCSGGGGVSSGGGSGSSDAAGNDVIRGAEHRQRLLAAARAGRRHTLAFPGHHPKLLSGGGGGGCGNGGAGGAIYYPSQSQHNSSHNHPRTSSSLASQHRRRVSLQDAFTGIGSMAALAGAIPNLPRVTSCGRFPSGGSAGSSGSGGALVPMGLWFGSTHRRSMCSTRKQSEDLVKELLVRQDKKAARLLGLLATVFTLCWLPSTVVHVLSAVGPPLHVAAWVRDIVRWVLLANSAVNPFLYGLLNAEFRKILRQWFYFRRGGASRGLGGGKGSYRLKHALLYWSLPPNADSDGVLKDGGMTSSCHGRFSTLPIKE